MEEFMKFDLLSWFSPSRSPTFEGKINSNSSLASDFQGRNGSLFTLGAMAFFGIVLDPLTVSLQILAPAYLIGYYWAHNVCKDMFWISSKNFEIHYVH